MKIKKIWFVSHYSMPPEYEMRIKTQMFAHYLGELGVECTIFSASTIHNTNINLITGTEEYIEREYDDLKFVHIKCSNYCKTDLRRIVNMEQFSFRFKKIAKNFEPPDVIVADTYCISYRPIYEYCRAHSIPFVVDVRDLWPQSIVEYLGFSEKNPIILAMYKMEKNMYINADRIIFSFDGGYDYIQDRNLNVAVPKNKVFFINNGVDLDEFKLNSVKYKITDSDLDNSTLFKVVYVGSIRKVNNLGLLLDAAKKVKNKNVRFLIWGSGDELEPLKKRISVEKIMNVVFKGFIEKKVAILGGQTTQDIKLVLELFLLNYGIKPHFYESEFNRYYEDGMFPNKELEDFAPDIIYICTSIRNITVFPEMEDTVSIVNNKVDSEISRLTGLWENLAKIYRCPIIQNNYEYPFYRLLGNMDASDYRRPARVNRILPVRRRT